MCDVGPCMCECWCVCWCVCVLAEWRILAQWPLFYSCWLISGLLVFNPRLLSPLPLPSPASLCHRNGHLSPAIHRPSGDLPSLSELLYAPYAVVVVVVVLQSCGALMSVSVTGARTGAKACGRGVSDFLQPGEAAERSRATDSTQPANTEWAATQTMNAP